MKLADIPPGSQLAYRWAVKLISEQIEFELEVRRSMYGTETEKVSELLASTPDWSIFSKDGD